MEKEMQEEQDKLAGDSNDSSYSDESDDEEDDESQSANDTSNDNNSESETSGSHHHKDDSKNNGNPGEAELLGNNQSYDYGPGYSGRKKPHKYLRESIENTTGDINVRFIPTKRGGMSLLFRGFCFRISRKQNNKSYWRCQTAGCKVTVVIDNETFKSISGHHSHEPDEEIKLMKIEKKMEKLEKARQARAERLMKMREKQENKKRLMEEKVTKKAIEMGLDNNDKESIERLFQDASKQEWSEEDFLRFDDKLCQFFARFHTTSLDGLMNTGLDLENIRRDWDEIKAKVRSLAARRSKKREKKLRAIRRQLDQVNNEKQSLLNERKQLIQDLGSLNIASLEMFLTDLKSITSRYNHNDIDLNSSGDCLNSSSTNKTIPSIDISQVSECDATDYKVLYEQAIKERDFWKSKLLSTIQTDQSNLAQPSQLFINNRPPPLPPPPQLSQPQPASTPQIYSTSPSHLSMTIGSNSSSPNIVIHPRAQSNGINALPTSLREPQVILCDGSSVQQMWTTF